MFMSFIGLLIGTFELLVFDRAAYKIGLYLVYIPIGMYICSLSAPGKLAPLMHKYRLLLSVCSLTVGCIGCVITMADLSLNRMGAYPPTRLWVYTGCVFVGLLFIPRMQ